MRRVLTAAALLAGCATHQPAPTVRVASLAPYADDRGPVTEAPTSTTSTSTTEAPTTEAPYVPPVTEPARSSGGNFDALAQCESGGNPRATNGTDWGAFQFDDQTWRATTGLSGHASDYPYGTQLAAAERLYAQRGRAPWPYCGRFL